MGWCWERHRIWSPEPFSGHPVDARSDIYSLAVTLYELLTGVLPFEVTSTRAWASAHQSAPPRPFASTESGRQVPAGVQHAVLWALAKEPARRPESAGAFHAALEAGLGGAAPAAVIAPTVLLGFDPPRAEAPHAAPARTTGAVSMTEPSPFAASPRATGASIPWPPPPPPPAPPRRWWSRSLGIGTLGSAWLLAVPCLMVIAIALSRRGPEPGVAPIETPGGDPAGAVMLPLQPAAPPNGAPSLPGPAKPEASAPASPSAKPEASAPALPSAKPEASAPTPPSAKPEAPMSATPRPKPAPRSTPAPEKPESAPMPREPRSSPSSRDGLAVGARREFAPGLIVERIDTVGPSVRLRISAWSHVHVYIDGHDGDSLDDADYDDDDEPREDDELRFVVEGGSVRVPWLSPGRHHVHAYWPNGHETQADIYFGPGRLNIEVRDPGWSRQ